MGLGLFEMIAGNLVSFGVLGMVFVGVLKVVRMARDVHDIRELLKDLQRENRLLSHTPAQPGAAAQEEQSRTATLALMRAVNGEESVRASESVGKP